MKEIVIGQDPAHVMTRVDTEQVHVTLNGEDAVVEFNKTPSGDITINPARSGGQGRIPMQAVGGIADAASCPLDEPRGYKDGDAKLEFK